MGYAAPSTYAEKRPGSFNIMPMSANASDGPGPPEYASPPVALNHVESDHKSPRAAPNVEIPDISEQSSHTNEEHEVVDLIHDSHRHRQSDSLFHVPAQEDRPMHTGSARANDHSPSSEVGGRISGTSGEDRRSVESVHEMPKTSQLHLTSDRVVKNRHVPRQQLSSLPSGNSGVSAGRVPSEEDLYFLLLHRYRKREQTEKQLAARLRQVEIKNAELSQTAQEYQQLLEASEAASNKQADQMRAQKSVIMNIKDGYLRIKEFMKDVYTDQEALKAKATLISQDRQTLHGECEHIRSAIKEASDATISSIDSVNKFKTRIAELCQEALHLETSVHDANSKLQSEHDLLMQEQIRNAKAEKRLDEITRQQKTFNLAIQQEQQHVLSALNRIQSNLSNLDADRDVVAALPPELPALDQCVELLTGLAKVETASPADITDMVHVLRGLAERYACILPLFVYGC
jgi:myosin heavy subunit